MVNLLENIFLYYSKRKYRVDDCKQSFRLSFSKYREDGCKQIPTGLGSRSGSLVPPPPSRPPPPHKHTSK